MDARIALCQASRVFAPLAHARSQAASISPAQWASLSAPLHPRDATKTTPIDPHREHLHSLWLIICNFDVGIFVRSLGGHYTGDFNDLDAIDDAISDLRSVVPHAQNPPIDFDKATHTLHHGFPRDANFHCRREDTLFRNLYDNHSTIDDHRDIIAEKIQIDVNKSYALSVHRWLLHFIDGLILSALGIVFRKQKSRMVNDPSNPVRPGDTGALNDQFDKKDPEQVPPVAIGSALTRVIYRLWNLRLQHPDAHICIYKDDLVSAFRRIRYHPDVIPAFAYVFQNRLLLPVGGLFGPRNTPGWFCNLSDLRSFASEHLPAAQAAGTCELIQRVRFSPFPSTSPSHAKADDLNPGTSSNSLGPQPCFVDDTIMLETSSNIRTAANASAFTADLLFGGHPLLEDPISEEKFEAFFSHYCDVLGFDFDAHHMLCIYPAAKRSELKSMLDAIPWDQHSPSVVLLTLASIQGKIRHLSQILPLGTYLSLRLHFLLSSVIRSRAARMHITKKNLKFKMKALWRDSTPIFLPPAVRRHLLLLRTILLSPSTHVWARPIGLLVHRRPDAVTHTDASLVGLGGLSIQLQFMWRCTCDTFALPGAKPLHINILELMAYIINIYFVLLRLRLPTPWKMCATDHNIGFLLHALIDNTSALGWIRHGARSTHPQVRKLCEFLLLLIFEANSSFPFHVQPFHIAGKLNTHANAISRPQDYPA